MEAIWRKVSFGIAGVDMGVQYHEELARSGQPVLRGGERGSRAGPEDGVDRWPAA